MVTSVKMSACGSVNSPSGPEDEAGSGCGSVAGGRGHLPETGEECRQAAKWCGIKMLVCY